MVSAQNAVRRSTPPRPNPTRRPMASGSAASISARNWARRRGRSGAARRCPGRWTSVAWSASIGNRDRVLPGETMPRTIFGPFALCAVLLAGCVPQSNNDALQQRYEQSQAANQKLAAENQALQVQLQQSQQAQQGQQNTYTISADMLFVPHEFSLST